VSGDGGIHLSCWGIHLPCWGYTSVRPGASISHAGDIHLSGCGHTSFRGHTVSGWWHTSDMMALVFDTSYIVFEVANMQIMCSWFMNCGILNEYDTVDTKYLILI
jgi:hypothetical protein